MLTIAVSSIVQLEPAPYDLLLVLLIGSAFVSGNLKYYPDHFWPVICLLLFLGANLFSLFFVQDFGVASYYFIITVYCIAAWAGIVGIGTYFGPRLFQLIFFAYIIAAIMVVIPGITAYLHPASGLDFFLWEGRVQGLFKDPNVFGPFLIPPALFALWKIGSKKQAAATTFFWILFFIILTLGVLLSFSRAAWGHFILASGIYFLFINDAQTKRMRTLFILTIVFIPVLIYAVMATSIGDLFFDRLGLQGYDQVRFQKQGASLEYMIVYPLGFGPGQSELFLNHSTHNLFIRIVSENGLFGGIFFSLFYLLSLWRAIYMGRVAPAHFRGFFIIITASLLGILFNSIFIDTMHWRHFWLLLALPWIYMKQEIVSKKYRTL